MSGIIYKHDESNDNDHHDGRDCAHTHTLSLAQNILAYVEEDEAIVQNLHLATGAVLKSFTYIDSADMPKTITLSTSPVTITDTLSGSTVTVNPFGTITLNTASVKESLGEMLGNLEDTFHYSVISGSTSQTYTANFFIQADDSLSASFVVMKNNGHPVSEESNSPFLVNTQSIVFTLINIDFVDSTGVTLVPGKTTSVNGVALSHFCNGLSWSSDRTSNSTNYIYPNSSWY